MLKFSPRWKWTFASFWWYSPNIFMPAWYFIFYLNCVTVTRKMCADRSASGSIKIYLSAKFVVNISSWSKAVTRFYPHRFYLKSWKKASWELLPFLWWCAFTFSTPLTTEAIIISSRLLLLHLVLQQEKWKLPLWNHILLPTTEHARQTLYVLFVWNGVSSQNVDCEFHASHFPWRTSFKLFQFFFLFSLQLSYITNCIHMTEESSFTQK